MCASWRGAKKIDKLPRVSLTCISVVNMAAQIDDDAASSAKSSDSSDVNSSTGSDCIAFSMSTVHIFLDSNIEFQIWFSCFWIPSSWIVGSLSVFNIICLFQSRFFYSILFSRSTVFFSALSILSFSLLSTHTRAYSTVKRERGISEEKGRPTRIILLSLSFYDQSKM